MIKAVSAHYAENHAKDKGGSTWYEYYGVWFAGQFRRSIAEKHHPLVWVYLDVDPSKLQQGEYDVEVWGKAGKLLYWRAQGYPRGIVVSAEEPELLEKALGVMELAPWDFSPIFELNCL